MSQGKLFLVLCASCTAFIGANVARPNSCPTPLVNALQAQDVVLADGSHVSGTLDVNTLTVPVGATVFVDDNLRVRASSRISIFGTLQVLNRPIDAETTIGIPVELDSQGDILIYGQIVGGMGVSYSDTNPEFAERDGGVGSIIVLEAPVTWVNGKVWAGAGGCGGAGGRGGDGGAIVIAGLSFTHSPHDPAQAQASFQFIGGKGGKGGDGRFGRDPGEGGDGGRVCAAPGNQTIEIENGYWNSQPFPPATPPHHHFDLGSVNPATCPDGANGAGGSWGYTGDGGAGGAGADGTAEAPNGGKGARGGAGGLLALGWPGGAAKDSEPCCNPPGQGGKGGTGGDGGHSFGGLGGAGGRGGDAFSSQGQYQGNGGNGGNGGPGTPMSTAGSGGKGGNGGDGNPPGPLGLGGAKGLASYGVGGNPGVGGFGIQNGTAGSYGANGLFFDGAVGGDGQAGIACNN